MSEIMVSLRLQLSDLQKLSALARFDDSTTVGEQIRTALKQYLDHRATEVEFTLQVITEEENAILRRLLGE